MAACNGKKIIVKIDSFNCLLNTVLRHTLINPSNNPSGIGTKLFFQQSTDDEVSLHVSSTLYEKQALESHTFS